MRQFILIEKSYILYAGVGCAVLCQAYMRIADGRIPNVQAMDAGQSDGL